MNKNLLFFFTFIFCQTIQCMDISSLDEDSPLWDDLPSEIHIQGHPQPLDFQIGLHEAGVIDKVQIFHAHLDENTALLFKKTNKKKHNHISPDTLQLMTNFLSLPPELVDYGIEFLDNHSLAYFIRLKYLRKETRSNLVKRLSQIHAVYLYNKSKQINNSDRSSLKKLFIHAIKFGKLHNVPYYNDLDQLNQLLNKYYVDHSQFSHLLSIYSNNIKNYAQELNSNNKEYYSLHNKFLTYLLYKTSSRIKYRILINQSLLANRYILPIQFCCLSALCCCNTLMTANAGAIALGMVFSSGLGAGSLCCLCVLCSMNFCCKTPELAVIKEYLPCLRIICPTNVLNFDLLFEGSRSELLKIKSLIESSKTTLEHQCQPNLESIEEM